jgi:hypothetical protein
MAHARASFPAAAPPRAATIGKKCLLSALPDPDPALLRPQMRRVRHVLPSVRNASPDMARCRKSAPANIPRTNRLPKIVKNGKYLII